MSRALAPRTLAAYKNALALAFRKPTPERAIDEFCLTLEFLKEATIESWGNSALNQLKCAVRWARTNNGLEPKDLDLERALAPKYVEEKQVYTPSEFEMEHLEGIATEQPKPARCAVLLILYLGLRVEEFYMLNRRQVERAVDTKLLTFRRKGGREASLDATKIVTLFEELLLLPARLPQGSTKRPHKWERVGEVYSSGKPSAQYQVIRRMVGDVTQAADLGRLSPHKLRHAFATRMNRDGASPFIIQAALNHRSIATTQRYVHAGSAEVAKFMRGPKGEMKK